MNTPKISAQKHAAKVLDDNHLSLHLVEWAPGIHEIIALMIENAYLTGFNKGLMTATGIQAHHGVIGCPKCGADFPGGKGGIEFEQHICPGGGHEL